MKIGIVNGAGQRKNQMNEIACFTLGFGFGILLSPILGLLVFSRLSQRRTRLVEIESVADDLEKRRAARDSGRAEQLRPDAGPEALESNLFAIRPGKLELNRRQEKRRMLAERLAMRQDSRSMGESGSDSDQTRS